MVYRFALCLVCLLAVGMVLSGCGGERNLWDATDEIFFFHGLQDGDTDVPINAVFGFKPSGAVASMKLYDSSGAEVPSEIHRDRDGHWYLSPNNFLDTYSWYTLVIEFEDGRTIEIEFRTGGSLPSNAQAQKTPSRPGYLIELKR